MPTYTSGSTTQKAAVGNANAGIHIKENFVPLLQQGIDDVFQREFEFPLEGEKFYTMRSTTKIAETFQGVIGIGNVGLNRDADVIPHDEKQLGFANSISNNVFRGRIGHEKTTIETEQYGMIGDSQEELAGASKRTYEIVMADPFNRAIGTNGAPFLCEDGYYFLDATRNNAHQRGGTWGNVQAAGAITEASIYTAQLSAKSNRSERGHLSPREIQSVVVRPTDEKAIWEILRSDLRPSDSMNARNFQFGRFEYTVYNHLSSALIFYRLTGKNELYFQTRVSPEIETFMASENPDVVYQRVRFAIGVGCNRPDAWLGGTVS